MNQSTCHKSRCKIPLGNKFVFTGTSVLAFICRIALGNMHVTPLPLFLIRSNTSIDLIKNCYVESFNIKKLHQAF